MKTFRKVAAAALCLLASSFACAGGTQTGTVNQLIVRASDGLIILWLNGTASGRPACATIGYWMIKNENSTAGKQQLAQLMMARALGIPVTVTGAGTCTRWSDGEDLDLVTIPGN